ncbi:MAG: glutathione S-transferase C-terminal domain-containing protein [Gammaproteobacteria bacterium]|nr:glutathione S-transferase C-terminal domain-containing protein [Gammaproteobacteria bacterium]MDH5227052.1 glutathione S-transferase C-terminal domain-containing protein [Gammaproteobacteria bacterium]
MRLRDPRVVHQIVLYALPVVVAAAGWGVVAAIGAALAVFLLGRVVRVVVTLRGLRQPQPRLRLHTITFSHYVEKARWCLDRLGVPYDEVPNIGILGVLLSGRTVPWLEVPPGLTRISESSRILRYLWAEYAGALPADRTWFLEPTPAALQLEARLDRRLGVDVRVWLYEQLLRHPDLSYRSWGIAEPGIPRWQRALLLALRPVLAFAVRRMLGVTPARADRALARTREIFDEMDALLADGRRYLTGSTLTFADITFASLGALAVLPPEYPGNRLGGPRLAVDDIPDVEWKAEIERFRARPSGQFILRLYREERAPHPG